MADDQENGPDMAADTARQETEVGGGNLENEEQSVQQQQPLHAEPGILSEALITIGHGIATPPQERAPPAVVAHLDSNEQPIDTSGSIEDTCEALSKVEKILERLTQGAGLLANYGDEQKVAETVEYGAGGEEEEQQQQQPKAPDTPFISPFERFYFNKPGAPSTATLPTSEPSDESPVPNEPSSKTFTPPALTPIEETEHVAVAAAAPEKNEEDEQQQQQQQQQQPEERIEENETPEKQEEKDDGNQQLSPGIDEGVAENQLLQSPAQQVAEESGDSAANEENETRNEESENRVNKELVDDDRVESEKEDAKTYEAPTQDIGEPELQREEDEGDSPRQPIDNEVKHCNKPMEFFSNLKNENAPPPPPTETQEDLAEEGGAQDAANTKESEAEGIEESTPVVETDADVHLICAPAKSSTDNVDEQDDFTTPQRSLGSKKTSIELTIEQKPTDAEERDESAAEYIVVKEEESQEDALEAVSSVSPISDESYDIVESSLGTGE